MSTCDQWRQAGVILFSTSMVLIHFIQARTEIQSWIMPLVIKRTEIRMANRSILENISVCNDSINIQRFAKCRTNSFHNREIGTRGHSHYSSRSTHGTTENFLGGVNRSVALFYAYFKPRRFAIILHKNLSPNLFRFG